MTDVVKAHFTTDDLVRYAKLSRHMVNYLCRYGVLEPTLSTERRRGLDRKFSYADLLLGRAVATLLSAGVSVIALRSALNTLRRKLKAVPLALFQSRAIAIVGSGVYISEPDQPLVDLTANGQLAFHFVLDATQLQQFNAERPKSRLPAVRPSREQARRIR
jgi:DNA-binding transcriptional MerR regulator